MQCLATALGVVWQSINELGNRRILEDVTHSMTLALEQVIENDVKEHQFDVIQSLCIGVKELMHCEKFAFWSVDNDDLVLRESVFF